MRLTGGVFPLVANAAVEDNVGGMSEDVAKENLSEQLDRIDDGDGTDADEDESYYSSSTDIDGIRESGTSSSGTLIADANDILYGKLAIIQTGETVKVVTGEMPNYAGKTQTVSTVTESGDNALITIPATGYYDTESQLSVSIETLKKEISKLNASTSTQVKYVQASRIPSVLSVSISADQPYGTYHFNGTAAIYDIINGKYILCQNFSDHNTWHTYTTTTANGDVLTIKATGDTVYGCYKPWATIRVYNASGNLISSASESGSSYLIIP